MLGVGAAFVGVVSEALVSVLFGGVLAVVTSIEFGLGFVAVMGVLLEATWPWYAVSGGLAVVFGAIHLAQWVSWRAEHDELEWERDRLRAPEPPTWQQGPAPSLEVFQL